MNRQQSNLQILSLLKDYVLAHPDWRFGQLLSNIGLANKLDNKDIFFTEPDKMLEELKTEPTVLVNVDIEDLKNNTMQSYSFQFPEKALSGSLPRQEEIWVAFKAAYQDHVLKPKA